MDLEALVSRAVTSHPAVNAVRLVGSRAERRATALSDWDFLVETDEPERLRAQLPALLEPHAPLAAQWDRLSEEATYYMLVLEDGTKVDVVLDVPPVLEPPWTVDERTLAGVDTHFWDWILWLGGKALAGRHDLVGGQLTGLMYDHLLAPVGVHERPRTIREAIDRYRDARDARERELGVGVDRSLERAVLRRLESAGVA